MSLTTLLIPTYTQMLTTLSGWLDKAATERADAADALLGARLAPDMFPLATQVRFACVQPYEAVALLTGGAMPPEAATLRDEALGAGERPGTIADARARIAETVAMLATLAPYALDGDAARPIAHALPMGMIFDLTAEQYARDWTLPQFYFHLMTAYTILRNQGVGLGKADYVPHMFAYLRPGTMPGR